MDLVEKYLTEKKYEKFKTEYKKGDIIEVEAERQAIYDHPGYVERMKITKMKLKINSRAKFGENAYVVTALGKYSKYAGGIKVPKSFRLSIHSDLTMGTLTTSSPKPLKYLVSLK